jgi:hypothetical protein
MHRLGEHRMSKAKRSGRDEQARQPPAPMRHRVIYASVGRDEGLPEEFLRAAAERLNRRGDSRVDGVSGAPGVRGGRSTG